MSSAVVMRLSGDALDEAPAHVLDRDPAHLGLPGDDAVDAVALDGARGDRVDPDIERGQLEREAVGHADLPRLGRAVADAERQPAPTRGGRDVDDHPAARPDHLRHREARAHVGAGEAGVDRVEPVVGRVLLHALGRPAVARVVHEDVELAERFDARRDHLLHVAFRGRVAGHRHRAAAVALDQRGGLLHQVAAAGRADHRGAFLREQAAHHATDALAGAGDERHLPVELSHGFVLRPRVILTPPGVYLFLRPRESRTSTAPVVGVYTRRRPRPTMACGLKRRCAGGATMTTKSVKTRIASAVIGLSLVTIATTACGTLGGAAVGAGAGAAVGAGTGYGAGKGALIGTGVGAAAGAIYDITKKLTGGAHEAVQGIGGGYHGRDPALGGVRGRAEQALVRSAEGGGASEGGGARGAGGRHGRQGRGGGGRRQDARVPGLEGDAPGSEGRGQDRGQSPLASEPAEIG